MFQRAFATMLGFALIISQVSASAAGVTPLGVVTQASRANIAHADVSAGATVFDGDLLTTSSDGLLRVRVGAAQFYMASQSSLNLQSVPGGALAKLAAGTIVFSSAKAAAMEVEVAQAHIRAAGDQPTVAQISVAGPKAINVRAQRGSVQFSYRGQTQLVPEGVAYRFVLDPSDEDLRASTATHAFPDANPRPPGKPSKFIYFIIGAIGVATYIAVDEALESPDKP